MRNLLILAPVLLGACAATPAPPASGGECRDNNLSQFVGQPRSDALARQIQAQSGAAIFRWLPEGTMVTMEFNANRVNAHLDSANRVSRVVCG